MSDPTAPLSFHLNGKRMFLARVDPKTLLVDYLREQGLTGTKVACGQGGCGACTVMLSRRDASGRLRHLAVNSCLRPLCSIGGMAVTTTEGLGNARDGVSPVQSAIPEHNGSQCGFCTPGFVMTAHALFADKERVTTEDIENGFDGNLCRCTGYRAILDGLHSLMKENAAPVKAQIPKIDAAPARGHFAGGEVEWIEPANLAEACELKAKFTQKFGASHVRLVAGNTSTGVYPDERARVMIEVSRIAELQAAAAAEDSIRVGAAITISELIDFLSTLIEKLPKERTAGLAALRRHALQIACVQVRNAGSIAGNIAMTKSHEHRGVPFPSDLFTVFATLGAKVRVASPEMKEYGLLAMPELGAAALIESFAIPLTQAGEYVETYKVARRPQNAHALVNAGFRVRLSRERVVEAATIVYGGLARIAVRMPRTEQSLVGARWDDAALHRTLEVLASEIREVVVPGLDEGISVDYRAGLAEAMFYRFFIKLALNIHPKEVHKPNASAGDELDRPVSHGSAAYNLYRNDFPVGRPMVKFDALLQATGEARYTHDLDAPGQLHGAMVVSRRAHARFHFKSIEKLGTIFPAFCDLVTVADVPRAGKNLQGPGQDDPVFCDGEATCVGAPLAMVIAAGEAAAKEIAAHIEAECVEYHDVKPVYVTLESAVKANNTFRDLPGWNHLPNITRPGSDAAWLADPAHPLPGTKLVSGTVESGAQAQFYMETQAALAVPTERDLMTVYSSTQDPSGTQSTIASTLGVPANRVTVVVDRIGGGFGGKQTRAAYFAAAAAVAANKLRRPVKLVLDRATDLTMVGKRHPFQGEYRAAYTSDGVIKGLSTRYISDGGNTYDLSFPVMDLAQFLGDNVYMIGTYRTEGQVYRTNKASNTAMRSFGTIQSLLIQEDAIEHVAHRLNVLPEHVRRKNMYRDGTPEHFDRTPYGQELVFCNIRRLWDQLWSTSDFETREREIREYNRRNRWRKRGISMIPLKYGISYTGPRGTLNQGGAAVHVFAADGSVLVQHGGVELGQGVDTKMAQIAAQTLGIPLKYIRVAGSRTDTVPNATATAASTGSDLNGGAIALACRRLRARLEKFCGELQNFRQHKAIDDWQLLWAEKWPDIVSQAYVFRVGLSEYALYRTPHYSGVDPDHPLGHPFFYYTYSASASEVEIDVLTGEFNVLRADILYDAGRSLNPLIDVGQLQGAFVQGIGHVATEEIVYRDDGSLYSDNTWTYKPPCSKTIPVDFRVALFDDPERKFRFEALVDAAVKCSKATGEPPLVLATSVFFAIKHAILAARRDSGDNDWFALPAPATVERIQQACRVQRSQMKL